jgi:hypothetical protein
MNKEHPNFDLDDDCPTTVNLDDDGCKLFCLGDNDYKRFLKENSEKIAFLLKANQILFDDGDESATTERIIYILRSVFNRIIWQIIHQSRSFLPIKMLTNGMNIIS